MSSSASANPTLQLCSIKLSQQHHKVKALSMNISAVVRPPRNNHQKTKARSSCLAGKTCSILRATAVSPPSRADCKGVERGHKGRLPQIVYKALAEATITPGKRTQCSCKFSHEYIRSQGGRKFSHECARVPSVQVFTFVYQRFQCSIQVLTG